MYVSIKNRYEVSSLSITAWHSKAGPLRGGTIEGLVDKLGDSSTPRLGPEYRLCPVAEVRSERSYSFDAVNCMKNIYSVIRIY